MPRPRRVQVTRELVMPDRSDPERHVDLSSLFIAPDVQALNIPLDAIQPNPFQPRQDFDPQNLAELAAGIRAHGFLGTLLARPAPNWPETYQLAYGERRWRAARLAGLPAVPVIVRPISDQEMLEIAITENVLRADLNPLEEAEGYQQMMKLFGYSERKLAERVGKTRSYIQHRLRILRAPVEVRELVRDRPDTLRYVAPLMAVADPQIRAVLVAEIRRGHLISDDIPENAALLNEFRHYAETGETGSAPWPAARSPGRVPRDRLSTATRAVTALVRSKRARHDPESLDQLHRLRELIDGFLHQWEPGDGAGSPGGSRVSQAERPPAGPPPV